MKPNDNLINVIPDLQVQKRTEAVLGFSSSLPYHRAPPKLGIISISHEHRVCSTQRAATSLPSEDALCLSESHDVSRASVNKEYLHTVLGRRLYS